MLDSAPVSEVKVGTISAEDRELRLRCFNASLLIANPEFKDAVSLGHLVEKVSRFVLDGTPWRTLEKVPIDSETHKL